MQIRWANVQAIDVKFSQDITHQKSLKSVKFWQSYWKNKKVDVFWDTVYIWVSTASTVPLLAHVNSSSCSLYVIVRPSDCRLSSVTLVHPTQTIEIFGNVFTPFGTLAIRDLCIKILRRSSQGNPSVGGLNRRRVAKYSDFGPIDGYISETVQDRR